MSTMESQVLQNDQNLIIYDMIILYPNTIPIHCRFCAKENIYANLLNLSQDEEALTQNINMLEFLKVDFVDLSNLKLPRFSCKTCYKALKSAYNFIGMVKQSQIEINRAYLECTSADINMELDNKVFKNETPETSSQNTQIGIKNETEVSTDVIDTNETPFANRIQPNDIKDELEKLSEALNHFVPLVDRIITQDSESSDSDTCSPTFEPAVHKNVTMDDKSTKTTLNIPINISKLNLKYNAAQTETNYAHTEADQPIAVSDSNKNDSTSHSVMPVFDPAVHKNVTSANISNKPTNINLKANTEAAQSPLADILPQDSGSSVSDTKNDSNSHSSVLTVVNPAIQDNEMSADADTNNQNNTSPETVRICKETNVPNVCMEIGSWASYPWFCKHCNTKFDSMFEVRDHSKLVHNICYAFKCVDCNNHFNMFNPFVEHVRQHQSVLRNYCQYCNSQFETRADCERHALSHWEGTQKICDRCGLIFPDVETLASHRQHYRQARLPRSYYRNKAFQVAPELSDEIPMVQRDELSWKDYEWTCQDCGVRAPDVDNLREHARSFHNKCFAMKCVDCLKVYRCYFLFVPHVTKHRPYLKHYCQYCNLKFDDLTDLSNHVNEHLTGDQRPCDGCGQIFENSTQLIQHLKQYDPPRRKQSIIYIEELTCDVCFKLFTSLTRMRVHRKTHGNRKRDHICDTCGKGFYTVFMLSDHMVTHKVKAEVCQICKRKFVSKHRLRRHVVTHLEAKLLTCDDCGKSFRNKSTLRGHVRTHSDVKKFKCIVCNKQFKCYAYLNNHMNVHTGSRPFSCERCERTFNNFGNCNKHMIRKHGVPFAKSKITPKGRVDIDKQTGKIKKLALDSKSKEWMSEMVKSKLPKKKSTLDIGS